MVKDEGHGLGQACRRKGKLCLRQIKLSSWCGQTRLCNKVMLEIAEQYFSHFVNVKDSAVMIK